MGWCNVARVSTIVIQKWLGHLARVPDERLPKGVLFGHMNGSGVRGRSQQGVEYVRESCTLQGWRNPKTGQPGGLPWNVCSNAPDLRIGRRIVDETL